MDLQKEIDRRCRILSDVKNRYGVKVWYIDDTSKSYTFLSTKQIEPGLYRNENTDGDFVYVESSSYDILYDLAPAELTAILNNTKEFGKDYVHADEELRYIHSTQLFEAVNSDYYRHILKNLIARELVSSPLVYLYFVNKYQCGPYTSFTKEWFKRLSLQVFGSYSETQLDKEIKMIHDDLLNTELKFLH